MTDGTLEGKDLLLGGALAALGLGGWLLLRGKPAPPPAGSSAWPTGTLLKQQGAMTVYVVQADGSIRPIVSQSAFTACGYIWQMVITVPSLAGLVVGPAIGGPPDCPAGNAVPAAITPTLVPGQLYKAPANPTVYYIDRSGAKRGIVNPQAFASCGWNFQNVLSATQDVLNNAPVGALIPPCPQ